MSVMTVTATEAMKAEHYFRMRRVSLSIRNLLNALDALQEFSPETAGTCGAVRGALDRYTKIFDEACFATADEVLRTKRPVEND